MTATATTRHLPRGDGATAPVGLSGRPPRILGERTTPRTATATPVKPTPGHSGINSTTAQAVPRKRNKNVVPGNGASGRSAQGPQKPDNCAWRGTRPATSHESGEGKVRPRNGRAPSGPEGATNSNNKEGNNDMATKKKSKKGTTATASARAENGAAQDREAGTGNGTQASGQQQGAGKPKAEKTPPEPKKPQTLEELLRPENAYERAIAEHIRARHDEAIEAAIVKHQRSIKDCLKYIAGEARKRAKGAQCVVMADDEVFGLAAHFFLDGDTPSGVEAGAGVDASAAGKAGEGDGAPRRHQKIKKDTKKGKKVAAGDRRAA